jgi:hypothetical protein
VAGSKENWRANSTARFPVRSNGAVTRRWWQVGPACQRVREWDRVPVREGRCWAAAEMFAGPDLTPEALF